MINFNSSTYVSSNQLTNSPVKFNYFSLILTYSNNVLKTYIDGELDQHIEMKGLVLERMKIRKFEGWVDDAKSYGRSITENEAKFLSYKNAENKLFDYC
jgi:hypothetical protein